MKFTSRGTITLHARCDGELRALHFEVRDTGPGISQEQQQRLFRRFEQADGARTAAQYGGSGLGLAICRELAQAMQGRIQVERQLGRGTCFGVTLPLPLVVDVTPRCPPRGIATMRRTCHRCGCCWSRTMPPWPMWCGGC